MSDPGTKAAALSRTHRLTLLVALSLVTTFLVTLFTRESKSEFQVPEDVALGAGPPALLVGSSPQPSKPIAQVATTHFVRDLADGSPMAMLPLIARTKDRASTTQHMTNEAGEFQADRSSTFALRDETWQLANSSAMEYEGQLTLWVWRPIPLTGVVRPTDPEKPGDLRSVAVHARYAGPEVDIGARDTAPWQFAWLRNNGVPVDVSLGAPTRDGWFEGQIPCIRGFGVRATAVECEPASVVPHVDAEAVRAVVELHMRPCVMVRGIVRGSNGNPLRNAEVRAYVVREGALHDFSAGRVRHELQEAYSATWQEDQDKSLVTAIQRAYTDSSGRFEIPLRVRGDVWLVPFADGHHAPEFRLGANKGVDNVEIEMQRRDLRAVQLLRNGRVLSNGRFLVSDLTRRELQVARSITTDERGETNMDWMQRGREYVIVEANVANQETKPLSGYFTWNGEETLDLAHLRTHRN